MYTKEFIGVIGIKKDRQPFFQNNQFCKPNREDTSCEKLIITALQLKQEGDDTYEKNSYI